MTAVTRSKKQKNIGLIKEVQQELQKVTWTSREELKTFTKIVIGSTIFFGLGIYLTDLMIRGTLEWVNEIFKWVVG